MADLDDILIRRWLKGLKYFKSLVPSPVKGTLYSSEQHPFQTFLWSDYECDPKTKYTFTVIALFGEPAAPEQRYKSEVTIFTEPENDGRHGVWFNRGAVASHALSAEFKKSSLVVLYASVGKRVGICPWHCRL